MRRASGLRQRIRTGEMLIGTFIKTPAPHQAEIIGLAGLDFAVADSEHAPLGAQALDLLSLAARATDLPLLVRVPAIDRVTIASALDIGLAGVVVPHVANRAAAQAALDGAKFSHGKRGFSPSPRAGGYGTADAGAYRREADATSVVMVQIEDVEALENLDDIATVDDVDVLFIGPADLALSMGASDPGDARVQAAIEKVAAAGRRHGKAVAIFVSRPERMRQYSELGITVFICGSDQSLLLAGCGSLLAHRPAKLEN